MGQTQVAKTLGGTNIKSDIQWGIHWMGQTLNGTNSKWKNNDSNKHKVGQTSSETNIKWNKH